MPNPASQRPLGRFWSAYVDSTGATRVLDDRTGRRLVMRPPADCSYGFRHDPPQLSGRWALEVRAGTARLRRCGSRARTVLARRYAARDLQLGGGLVTWQEGSRAFAYELATGRRTAWDLTDPEHVLGIVHTRARIVIQHLVPPYLPPQPRYVIPLRPRCSTDCRTTSKPRAR